MEESSCLEVVAQVVSSYSFPSSWILAQQLINITNELMVLRTHLVGLCFSRETFEGIVHGFLEFLLACRELHFSSLRKDTNMWAMARESLALTADEIMAASKQHVALALLEPLLPADYIVAGFIIFMYCENGFPHVNEHVKAARSVVEGAGLCSEAGNRPWDHFLLSREETEEMQTEELGQGALHFAARCAVGALKYCPSHVPVLMDTEGQTLQWLSKLQSVFIQQFDEQTVIEQLAEARKTSVIFVLTNVPACISESLARAISVHGAMNSDDANPLFRLVAVTSSQTTPTWIIRSIHIPICARHLAIDMPWIILRAVHWQLQPSEAQRLEDCSRRIGAITSDIEASQRELYLTESKEEAAKLRLRLVEMERHMTELQKKRLCLQEERNKLVPISFVATQLYKIYCSANRMIKKRCSLQSFLTEQLHLWIDRYVNQARRPSSALGTIRRLLDRLSALRLGESSDSQSSSKISPEQIACFLATQFLSAFDNQDTFSVVVCAWKLQIEENMEQELVDVLLEHLSLGPPLPELELEAKFQRMATLLAALTLPLPEEGLTLESYCEWVLTRKQIVQRLGSLRRESDEFIVLGLWALRPGTTLIDNRTVASSILEIRSLWEEVMYFEKRASVQIIEHHAAMSQQLINRARTLENEADGLWKLASSVVLEKTVIDADCVVEHASTIQTLNTRKKELAALAQTLNIQMPATVILQRLVDLCLQADQ